MRLTAFVCLWGVLSGDDEPAEPGELWLQAWRRGDGITGVVYLPDNERRELEEVSVPLPFVVGDEEPLMAGRLLDEVMLPFIVAMRVGEGSGPGDREDAAWLGVLGVEVEGIGPDG